MDQGLLPRRYAKAMYKFAQEKGYTARAYELMGNLAAAFEQNPGLEPTLENPYIADAQKTALLMTASGADRSGKDAPMSDFFKLLENHGRIDIVRLIAIAYNALYRRENNIYRVDITSAQPLSDADRARVRAMVEKHLGGGTAEYTWQVDPSLIGGFTVTIDSQRLDASIKNELKQLRLNLLK